MVKFNLLDRNRTCCQPLSLAGILRITRESYKIGFVDVLCSKQMSRSLQILSCRQRERERERECHDTLWLLCVLSALSVCASKLLADPAEELLSEDTKRSARAPLLNYPLLMICIMRMFRSINNVRVFNWLDIVSATMLNKMFKNLKIICPPHCGVHSSRERRSCWSARCVLFLQPVLRCSKCRLKSFGTWLKGI